MSELQLSGMMVGPILTNCYILRDGGDGTQAVVVDPGGDAEKIVAALREMGAEPVAILLTHAHEDHIMGVNGIKAAFPEAKICIAERERRMVEDSALRSGFWNAEPIVPDRWLSDGEELELLGRRIRVIETPGHTEGSVCYYLPEEACLLAGDTLFREGFGRTDLPTGSAEQLMKSLELLLTTLPKETKVYPGHGPATTIGHEKMIEGFGD